MRTRLLALTILAILAVAPEARSEVPKPPEPPKTFDLEAIDAYVAGVVREKEITGLSLAIARDGKIVLAKGYGRRSIEDRAPVEPETSFAIGSVSKQFTCACILLLAQEGKLSVDDKVAKYFPGLTRAGEITLHQLMSHTSGYPDYYPLDFVDRRMSRPIGVDALIREYAGGKLDFPPGTRWSYSNTGFMILGKVVEKVSGQPFGVFLAERILKPLGMDRSTFEPSQADPNRARGYTPFALGPPEPCTPEAEGWIYAAGGVWASAPDLARWATALMEGKVLDPERLRIMTTPAALLDGRLTTYGCGIGVRRENGDIVLSHGGAVSGFRASLSMIPRLKASVVILMNNEQSDAGIGQAIVGLLTKPEGEPEVPKVDGPSPKEAALAFFREMQAGQVDRGKLGEEFAAYLTDERIAAAAPRLKPLGEPEKVEVRGVRERGGMEVAAIRLTFKDAVLDGSLYRTPDGKIQQLLFEKSP
ncbi:serine hydrolase domain-containing protein [Tundrisphaera lichenicola]|uniref:serine hydrolase domain-containing protein n=1 Tax=Tundrisphaera lichenicola TaxID=2029860 RepID=UPI003EBD5A43